MNRAILLFLSALLFTPPPIQAALIQGKILGTIDGRSKTEGDGDNVFGLNGDQLLGEQFIIDLYYRTDIAPISSSSSSIFQSQTKYSSDDPDLEWLGLTLTINEISYEVIGNKRRAVVLDTVASSNINTLDSISFSIEADSGPFDGSSKRRQFLSLNERLDEDTFNNSLLPTFLSSSNITRVINSSNFIIDDIDKNPQTGELLFRRFVQLELDVQSIELAAVPLPASIWFFLSALISLVAKKRIE